MKMTLALYMTPYGTISALNLSLKEAEIFNDYSQITEFVEVGFPDLPDETILARKIEIIDTLIDNERERSIKEMQKLQQQKQELLALTHQA